MRLPLAGTLLLGLLLTPTASHAAQSYDNCVGFIESVPAVITTQGVWCLRADVSTAISTGSAIQVNTNNVTIDCNDFKLGGLAAGDATQAFGIYATSRSNITITNCNVRGFYYGIHTAGGFGNRAISNILDGNTYLGIWLGSEGSTIRGNTVTDTGGSTATTNAAYGIASWFGVDIIDNTVNSVFSVGGISESFGIAAYNGSGASITGNRVRGVVAGATAYSIAAYTPSTAIERNQVFGDTTGTGIFCNTNSSTAVGNLISRVATSVATCQASGNIFNAN